MSCPFTKVLISSSNPGLTSHSGFCINAAVDRLNLSGRDLTERMRKLLMGAGYMMSTSAEWEIVKDIKEVMTYIAEDFDAEKKKTRG